MAYSSNGFGNAWDQTSPGTIRARTDKKGNEYFERAVRMRSHAPAKSGAPAYGISWERYSFPTQQAAPAPAAAPPPAPAPAPAPAPPAAPRPTPAPAPKPNITPPSASGSAGLVIGNKPTTVSGPSVADQVSKGIEAFKKSEAQRLAKLEAERKAAEEKKKRAEAIAARPNTVEGQAALKITKNVSSQLPGMPGYEASGLATIRNKLLTI